MIRACPTNARPRAVLRVVLVVVVSALALYLIYLLRRPLTWIVIAGFIAIALAAPVRVLERRSAGAGWRSRSSTSGWSSSRSRSAPCSCRRSSPRRRTSWTRCPTYAQGPAGVRAGQPQLRKLEEDYDITGKLAGGGARSCPSKLGGAAGVLRDIGLGIVNSLFAGVTILILSIFMVSQRRPLGRGRRSAADRSPPGRCCAGAATSISRRPSPATCAGALGQATVAGVPSFIVLSILGVPYAAALALIIALLDLVPLVGATLGAIIVGLVTLFNDFPTDTSSGWSGRSSTSRSRTRSSSRASRPATVNVQPIVVLIAVLFGSTLFGVLGALLRSRPPPRSRSRGARAATTGGSRGSTPAARRRVAVGAATPGRARGRAR